MSVRQALERLLADAHPLGAVPVALEQAQNRVLAEDLFSLRTQPPFSASAMDGYAVRACDVAIIGNQLRVIGEVAAGYVFDGTVGEFETVRIFTGAPVPASADAILIQEDATLLEDGFIRNNEIVTCGTYVRAAGLDFKTGDLLLSKGRLMDAGALSLAASGNHASVSVYKMPRIGILATGDELRLPGSDLVDGQIIASNFYGVAAILRDAGAEVIDLGIAADTQASLQAALEHAKAEQCDVLVTLGGASVGDHDLVRSTFINSGMQIDFWKIAMQPGKPLMHGSLDAMRIVGLPGNPVSSLVCSHVFLVPLVSALAGRVHHKHRLNATLVNDITANGSREHYMRAVVQKNANGFTARVFENQDSSLLSFYAACNALVIRTPNAEKANAGESVEFIALRNIE